MSGSTIYKDLLIDLFNLSDQDIKDIDHENQNGKTVVFVTLANHPSPCPVCANKKVRIKCYVDKTIRHSALTDRSCVIRYRARRYVCPICRTTYYEHNPFVFKRMKISIFTVQKILEDLKNYNETFSSVAARYHVSPTSVSSIFDNHVSIPRKQLSKRLNFDEVYAFKSAHSKYVCIILDHEKQVPIDILPSRRSDYLIEYFFNIPFEEREKVEMCCFDMYDPYRSTCRRAFPNATLVVDHFHVIQELGRNLTQIRIKAMKEINRKRDSARKEKAYDEAAIREFIKYDKQYYVLKKFNWLLFKDKDDPKIFGKEARYNAKFQRSMDYREFLEEILKCDDDLRKAYRLKCEITDFYKTADIDTAPGRLDELIQKLLTCDIKELHAFGKTLTKWKKEIINSFIVVSKDYIIDQDTGKEKIRERKMNNAIIENKNAIVKCVKKNANGYTNWNRFRNRIMYVLDPKAAYSLYPLEKEKQGS